jgi:hypothetical protein
MPTFFVGLLIWSILAGVFCLFVRGASDRQRTDVETDAALEPASN